LAHNRDVDAAVLSFAEQLKTTTIDATLDVGAGRPSRPPSFEFLRGTDQQGRDVLANVVLGTPARLKFGLIAGVRSQVLSIRERMYVQVARLNGVSPLGVVVRELLPNLAPFVAASFVGTVAAAILASIGLSALGLGPQNEASLGLTIYWAIFYGALIRQLWWWFLPPIVITIWLFVGLFMMTAGLDRIANPRLRATV
jgi:ABC-type dipeptide/oligopeptide/nickel transport system permease subunit